MDIAPELFLLAAGVVLLAYVIFGVSGFGSALINVPVLAHFLPLQTVVPLALLLDFSASLLTGTRFRRSVHGREIGVLVPFGILGTILGVILLVNLPREAALLALGALILCYGVYNFFRHEHATRISRRWAIPAGLLGGTIGGMFGTGGPVFVIYLSRRLTDTAQLRANLAAIFTLQTAARIVIFLISGLLLQLTVLLTALALFPVMLLGLRLGNLLHARLSRMRIMQVISALLILSGITLIGRALA